MAREVTDNETYIRLVDRIQNRDLIDETIVTDFEEIVKDGELALRIYDLAQMSMGKAGILYQYIGILCLCILFVYAFMHFMCLWMH